MEHIEYTPLNQSAYDNFVCEEDHNMQLKLFKVIAISAAIIIVGSFIINYSISKKKKANKTQVRS